MNLKIYGKFLPVSLAALAVAALVTAGCGNGITSGSLSGSGETGAAFVVGTDAPMASVVSFNVQIESIAASDSSGNTVQLISGTPTVDFARFNGLQTLLDLNDVAPGSYTSVTITLGSGTIGYLDTTTTEPTIQTMPANFSTSSVTETLASPLVVTQSGAPVGLHLDFNLRKSIAVDASGDITGDVTPVFEVNAVANSDSGAYIDQFDAAVVSVGTTSFVVQGPHGRLFTVNVNGQTSWENGESISDLTTSSIITLSGTLDRADATIDADDVAILSQDGFYAGGQVTYVNPSSGPATSFDLYVRGLLPTTTALELGQIATVDLTGSEKYFIYRMHNPLTQFLFNASSLLPGQHVSVGGPASAAAQNPVSGVKRVVLRQWGFNGTVVPGSVGATSGIASFQMQITGFAGILVPQTVTVYVADNTGFRNGLNQISDVSNITNVRVVGLLLKDPTNPGNTILLARYVDELQ